MIKYIPYANYVLTGLLLAKLLFRFVLHALVESIHKDPSKKDFRTLFLRRYRIHAKEELGFDSI
jgi:hypothetical protein